MGNYWRIIPLSYFPLVKFPPGGILGCTVCNRRATGSALAQTPHSRNFGNDANINKNVFFDEFRGKT